MCFHHNFPRAVEPKGTPQCLVVSENLYLKVLYTLAKKQNQDPKRRHLKYLEVEDML